MNLLLVLCCASMLAPALGAQLRVTANDNQKRANWDLAAASRKHHHRRKHHDQNASPSLQSEASYRQRLKNNWDVQYAGTIEVGGQKISTVIDTGSFELLVFSDNCTTCGAARGLYSEKLSNTFKSQGDFIGEHNFGSGTTQSNEAYETIQIGPFVSKSQHFWEVLSADMAILEDDYFHAILGMGPPGSAEKFAEINADDVHKEVATYLQNHDSLPKSIEQEVQHYDDTVTHLKKAKSFTESLGLDNVSICLGKAPGSGGYFVWNDHSTRDEPGKFTTVDVVGDIYWSANLSNVRLRANPSSSPDKQKLGCSGEVPCTAVVDSGTSLIVAPPEAIKKVQKLLDNWKDPTGDCSDVTGLPDLQFELNGNVFSLPPESYVGKLSGDVDENMRAIMPQLKTKSRRSKDSNVDRCVPLLMAGEVDSQFGELWILGMPFFRKFYTTFHFSEHGGQASGMSFAVADDGCRPDWPEDVLLRAQEVARPHHEPFRIDASKLRMPRLLEQRAPLNGIKTQSLLETKVKGKHHVHI